MGPVWPCPPALSSTWVFWSQQMFPSHSSPQPKSHPPWLVKSSFCSPENHGSLPPLHPFPQLIWSCNTASIREPSWRECHTFLQAWFLNLLAVLCDVNKLSNLSESSLFLSEVEMICVVPSSQGCEAIRSLVQCLAQMICAPNGGCHYCLRLPSSPLQYQAECRAQFPNSQAPGSDWSQAHLGKG